MTPHEWRRAQGRFTGDYQTYTIYGVTLAASFPLLAAEPAAHVAPDLWVGIEPARPDAASELLGAPMLEAVEGDQRLYAAGREGSKIHLQVNGIADFFVELDDRTMRCRPNAKADRGLIDVLLTGLVPALWLYLRGEVVLHAACVSLDHGTVAIVGGSGMGKSTLAAQLCGGGARLVGDDVLAVRPREGLVGWLGTAPELRLRSTASDLAQRLLPSAPRRTTADLRLAIRPAPVTTDHGCLEMILVPHPVHREGTLGFRRVPPVEALMVLSGFPRLTGWKDPVVLRRQFEGLASVVDCIPVVEAFVPWDHALPLDLAHEVEALLQDGGVGSEAAAPPHSAPPRPLEPRLQNY